MELVVSSISVTLFIVLAEIGTVVMGAVTSMIATKALKLIARFMIRRGSGVRLRDLSDRANPLAWLRSRAVPLAMVIPAMLVGIGSAAGPAFAGTLSTTTLQLEAGVETVLRHLPGFTNDLSCLARFRAFDREFFCNTRIGSVLEQEYDDILSGRSRLLTWGTGELRTVETGRWITHDIEGDNYVSLDGQLRSPGRVSDELNGLEVARGEPVVTLSTASFLLDLLSGTCLVPGSSVRYGSSNLVLRDVGGTIYEAEWYLEDYMIRGTTLFVTVLQFGSGRIIASGNSCKFGGAEYFIAEVGVEYTAEECQKIQPLRDTFVAKGVSSCTSLHTALIPANPEFFEGRGPAVIDVLDSGSVHFLGWKQGGLRNPTTTAIQGQGLHPDVPAEYSGANYDVLGPSEGDVVTVALSFMAGELRRYGMTTQPATETVPRIVLTWGSMLIASLTALLLAMGLAIRGERGLPVPTDVMTAYQAGCVDGHDWKRGCADPWEVDDQGLVWGITNNMPGNLDHLGFVLHPTKASFNRPLA